MVNNRDEEEVETRQAADVEKEGANRATGIVLSKEEEDGWVIGQEAEVGTVIERVRVEGAKLRVLLRLSASLVVCARSLPVVSNEPTDEEAAALSVASKLDED